ncbi:L-seryl-tRNA(Sec) selenium transferase [Actinomadura sp. KC216]|uniref:L-seryl-tRNA(Sec) selenium transferase n=1 Tax=Actinomadura sp. KC216 TaxID=2530370 RepID=UPI001046E0A2|nr:L-seryl-tRNA(Sec) selenium transferase [Actinomadura sp. KC216]TDB89005.1 L-seryl-tRNA(Sec) selenium transferase [Actinomadura sp. KC216]
MNTDPRRALPKMDALLAHPDVSARRRTWGHDAVADTARKVLANARSNLKGDPAPSLDQLAANVSKELDGLAAGRLRGVINATGVVLHTNLGRAPLSRAAREAIEAAAGYSTVEFDLRTGGRGKRGTAVNALLRTLTGAPAGLVVNNAAAALMLTLGALARGGEVVVSRGELVEIGGEFRIPAIMQAAGVDLVEVGTTNRTHLSDYANAITDRTALLLVVHTSNYRIEGFTARPGLDALVRLAREHSIPLVHDVGSGLVSGALGDEPTVLESLREDADLVIFSGDKLLGGPQAGLVVGRAELVGRLARHPIARAVRIDKLTLAALEATLMTHLAGTLDDLPVWRALRLTPEEIRPRAESLAQRLGGPAIVREGTSMAGGGSLPGEGLPSILVEIDPRPAREKTLLERLRAAEPPVIARMEKGRVIVDLRTVPVEQDEELSRIIQNALKESLESLPEKRDKC